VEGKSGETEGGGGKEREEEGVLTTSLGDWMELAGFPLGVSLPAFGSASPAPPMWELVLFQRYMDKLQRRKHFP
jgi:hypothetical protein